MSVGILAAAFWLAVGVPAFTQQGESPAKGTGIPGPSVSPEGTPSTPSQTARLSNEDRADIFMARKSYHDALDYYQRALKDKTNQNPRIWNKIGIARQNLQELSEARRAYKEAIRLRKDFSEPYNNIGTTYYLNDQAKKSLKWYRQAIERDPSNPAYHYNLGTALYATKRFKEAIESYQRVLDLDSNFFTSRSNVGTTLQARPADAKYFFYIAKVFAHNNRFEEAVRYLRRALEDGFKDFEMIDQDPDFKIMAEFPPYVELRATPPKSL
jgi:tetratricopeptide (TPR) repeat protein